VGTVATCEVNTLMITCKASHLPDILVFTVSHPNPTSHKEKGLVKVERFLGYAELAVLILNIHWLHRAISLVYAHTWSQWKQEVVLFWTVIVSI